MSSRPILTLMSKVFGNQFTGETWDGWRVLLKAMFALPLTDAELEAFEELTGRSTAPTVPAREVWAIAGRRGWQEHHRGAGGRVPDHVPDVQARSR